jgi:hypothetical protein
MTATLALPNSVTATLKVDLAAPYTVIPPMPQVTVSVDCEKGAVDVYNFLVPTLYQHIRVTNKDGNRKETTELKEYKFEDGKAKGEVWWTSYRYQLEAFVDKVKGRTPQTWITAEDSVENMKWIEEVYAKVWFLVPIINRNRSFTLHFSLVWAVGQSQPLFWKRNEFLTRLHNTFNESFIIKDRFPMALCN